MSLLARRVLVVCGLVALLSTASLAQASSIRSSIERRQHPGTSFFVKHANHVVVSSIQHSHR